MWKKLGITFFISRVLMLFLWYLTVTQIYQTYLSLNRESHYKLDDHYFIQGWPGFLFRMVPGNIEAQAIEFNGDVFRIDRIGVTDKFIIGRAGKNWFAIDRVKNTVTYPLSDENELEKVLGLTVGGIKIYSDAPEPYAYKIWNPRRLIVAVSILFCILLIGPIRIFRFLKLIFLNAFACVNRVR